MKADFIKSGLVCRNHIIGITSWEQIQFTGDSPKTTLMSIYQLQQTIDILKNLGYFEIYVTVMGDEEAVAMSPERYKGGVVCIAPLKEEEEYDE